GDRSTGVALPRGGRCGSRLCLLGSLHRHAWRRSRTPTDCRGARAVSVRHAVVFARPPSGVWVTSLGRTRTHKPGVRARIAAARCNTRIRSSRSSRNSPAWVGTRSADDVSDDGDVLIMGAYWPCQLKAEVPAKGRLRRPSVLDMLLARSTSPTSSA